MAKVSGIMDKIFSGKAVKRTVKFASDNPALFASATTFGLSAVVRPISIMAAPKTDRNDKKYAISKSLTSSAVGLGLTYAVSKPIEKAIKNIDKSPEMFLKSDTIKNLKGNSFNLAKSQKYLFATQFFKTSVGFLTALPKSALTCAILPFVANKLDKKSDKVSFGGKNPLSKGIGSIMNTKFMQKMSDKFSGSNLVQNMAIGTDILLTGAFINRVRKNKNIPEENKKPLINNSIFSTSLSILSSVGLNKALDKPTDKFIKYFMNLNKDIKNPEKYAQGIKTIKTVFVMGGVYYAVIPFISTLLSGIVKKSQNI